MDRWREHKRGRQRHREERDRQERQERRDRQERRSREEEREDRRNRDREREHGRSRPRQPRTFVYLPPPKLLPLHRRPRDDAPASRMFADLLRRGAWAVLIDWCIIKADPRLHLDLYG